MHPRQASVLALATEVADRTAGKKKRSEDKEALSTQSGPAVLWKYTDPEGGVFFLEVKRTTGVRSPFNGKVLPGGQKPERFTPSQVGKELKEDKAEAQAKNASADDEAARWKA